MIGGQVGIKGRVIYARKKQKSYFTMPDQPKFDPKHMGNMPRPLSPHLNIYRWEVTMLLSILHRFTGVFLWGVAVLIVLVATSQLLFHVMILSGAVLEIIKKFAYIIFAPVIFALALHGLNGVRHFFWDVGLGYNINVARFTAWACLLLSFFITLFVFFKMKG